MSDKANARQVGGDHYKTGGIELWDLFGPESIIFYATRYLQRWRKKNGVEDLEKALHCVQKLREIAPAHRATTGPLAVADDLFEAWLRNAVEGDDERGAIRRIVKHWRIDSELEYAGQQIEYLIKKASTPISKPERIYIGTVVTNTPRAGETEAQIAARERRVPRYEPRYEGDVPMTQYEPWVVTPDWLGRQEIGDDLIDAYWLRRTKDLYVLDPFVATANIPRVLRHCYLLRGDGNWTLDIRRCPVEARPYFPDLPLTQNMKEWEDRPEWQRVLYTWDPDKTKYSLSDMTRAWHVDEEEEA